MKVRNIDNKLKIDIIHSVIIFIISFSIFGIWVQHSFQGNYWGPFLPGDNFGIPPKESQIGMYPTSKVGWDAQFYYYQSNDILAQGDEYLHIDNPSYRYQKIGMPLIARIVSIMFGQQITPPFLYHLLQFLIVAIGFFVLIRWLRRNEINQIYAYAWILSVGVINSLAYGMPDPVGDAFFIMSIIFALSGQLLLYMIVTTLLLLVREGYALYAAIIFVLTFLGKIQCEKLDKKKQIILTMIPGIVVVLWMLYVTYRFGITPMESTKGMGLTDLPFIGAIKTFILAIKQGSVVNVIFNEFAVLILCICIYYVIKIRKTSYVWYAVLGYIILISSLGITVWIDYSGYMKALGSIIAIVIIGLPYINKKHIITVLSVVIILQGVIYNYHVKKDLLYVKYEKSEMIKQISGEKNDKLKEFKSELLSNKKKVSYQEKNILNRFRREVGEVNVTVKNNSTENWYANPEYGVNSINLSYRIYDKEGKTVLYDGLRKPLTSDILQGQSSNFNLQFAVPSDEGEYILRISMIQEGVAWFNDVEGGGYIDIPLIVS